MKDSQPKKKKRLFKRKSNTSVAAKNKASHVGVDKKIQRSTSRSKISTSSVQVRSVFTKVGDFIKKHETDFLFILIPLIMLVILYIIYLVNTSVSKNIENYKLISLSGTKIAPYPVVQNLIPPKVTAKAAIILDADSQKTLYEKNPHLRFSMASTVKIMTALVALDYYKLSSELAIKSFGVEGSGLNLQVGDKYYFEDLLYAMLLPSANDAAAAIADNFPGGREAFVTKMNEKAAVVHLNDTHYADPIGLNDDGDYSTVIDTARLGSYAIRRPEFAQVVGTRQKIIGNIYQTRQFNLYNLNRLLGYHGINGIKTGTTEGAGEVLVTSASENGHTFIIVVMNSKDRFTDTEALLDFAEENVSFVIPSAN